MGRRLQYPCQPPSIPLPLIFEVVVEHHVHRLHLAFGRLQRPDKRRGRFVRFCHMMLAKLSPTLNIGVGNWFSNTPSP